MNPATARSADRPRRQPRPSRRNGRAATMRRRSAPTPAAAIPALDIDTWLLQGLIWAAMVGMLAWFHAPLAALVHAVF